MEVPQSLATAVQAEAPGNTELQQALLFGAYGESGWGANMGSPSAGGYYGFTPPSAFGITFAQAQDPTTATAAILPSYQRVQAAGVPSSITNPEARAEWIALNAEQPAGVDPSNPSVQTGTSAQEQAQIQSSNQPTYYGQNTSFTGQSDVWAAIVGATGGKGSSSTPTQTPSKSQTSTSSSSATFAGIKLPGGLTGTIVGYVGMFLGLVIIIVGIAVTFRAGQKLEIAAPAAAKA